jgi:hypothetical protein
MTIKNVIQENRAQINKFELTVLPGVGTPVFTSVSGLEEELDASELPDRTVRSGGRKKPVEFDVVQPAHHEAEVAAMEQWYKDGQDPVQPGHLKTGILTIFDTEGSPRRVRTLPNLWNKKRVESDLDLEDDGAMHTITWTLQCDEILPD